MVIKKVFSRRKSNVCVSQPEVSFEYLSIEVVAGKFLLDLRNASTPTKMRLSELLITCHDFVRIERPWRVPNDTPSFFGCSARFDIQRRIFVRTVLIYYSDFSSAAARTFHIHRLCFTLLASQNIPVYYEGLLITLPAAIKPWQIRNQCQRSNQVVVLHRAFFQLRFMCQVFGKFLIKILLLFLLLARELGVCKLVYPKKSCTRHTCSSLSLLILFLYKNSSWNLVWPEVKIMFYCFATCSHLSIEATCHPRTAMAWFVFANY